MGAKKHKFIFFLILAFSTSIFAQAKLSLRNAVIISLNQNQTIKRIKAKVKEKEAEKEAAFGNYLPKVSLVGGYTYMGDNIQINMTHVKKSLDDIVAHYGVQIANDILPVPLPPEDLYKQLYGDLQKLPAYNLIIDKQHFPNANLTIMQPLFTGGKISAGSKFAEAALNEANIEVIKATNETIKKAVNTYLGVVLLEQVVQTRKEVVDGIRKHKEVAEKLVREGIIAKYNLLRAEVALAKAEAELEDDVNNLALAKLALNSVMGFENDTTFTLSDKLKFSDASVQLEAGVDTAFANQPVLKLLEQKKVMVEQKKTLAQSNMWPTIVAFGEVGFFRYDAPGVIQPPWIVGVQMKYNLFSGLKDYRNIQAAEYLKQQLDYANNDAKNKIKLWVHKSYNEINNAKTKYNKLAANIKLANETLRLAKRRFEEGYGTSLEVIDASLLLEGEKIKRAATLFKYYKALTEFYVALGKADKAVEIFESAQIQN